MPVAILETILSFGAIIAALIKLVSSLHGMKQGSSRIAIKRKDGSKIVISDVKNDKDLNELLDTLSK